MSKVSNKKIAITGTIGSGKSSVTKIIKEYYPTINADEIVDLLYKDSEIALIVNKTLFNKISDIIIKEEIASLIFSDTNKKDELEAIIFPLVKIKITEFFNDNEGLVFVEVPLLFEAKFEDLFDEIILVKTKENIIIERLMKYRKYSREQAKERIKVQFPVEIKEAKSDYIINNNDTLEKLRNNTLDVLKKIEGSSKNGIDG